MIKNKQAFTLIELLLVIAIIGILTSGATLSYLKIRASSRDVKRLSTISEVQNALALYYRDEGVYPSTLNFGGSLIGSTSPTVYLSNIPSAPDIADGSCLGVDNKFTYDLAEGGQFYNISYCLGGRAANINSGVHCATPQGIDMPSAYCTPDPAPTCDPNGTFNLVDADGDGKLDVNNCCELQHMTSGDYELVNNLDCYNTQTWNDGNGFAPINDFSGTLNGNGFAIKNLYSLNNTAPAGIFGYNIGSTTISNLKLKNFTISSSAPSGALIGWGNDNVSVNNCSLVNGSIITDSCAAGFVGGINSGNFILNVDNSAVSDSTISGNGPAGGFSGCAQIDFVANNSVLKNDSIISTGCSGGLAAQPNSALISGFSGNNLTIQGDSPTGGIAGCMSTGGAVNVSNASLSNSSITSNGQNAGGLIGYATNGSSNSLIFGIHLNNLIISSNATVGGFAGSIGDFTLSDYSIASSSISGSSCSGGFAGQYGSSATISGSHVNNLTITSSNAPAGGLLGCGGDVNIDNSSIASSSVVTPVCAAGLVGAGGSGSISTSSGSNLIISSTHGSPAGGLAGCVGGLNSINNSHVISAVVTVSGDTSGYAGGLAGGINGNISDSYVKNSQIDILGSPGGGLVGSLNGSISNSYAENTDVKVGIGGCAGGLSGSGGTSISASHFKGTVSATGDVPIGGLSGCTISGSISDSYAEMTATEGGTSSGGGLCSGVGGSISNSYFKGTLNTPNASGVGGLANHVGGSISNSYVIGDITADNGVCGLVENINGDISNSFFRGSITATGDTVGGLAGSMSGGNISNSYVEASISGRNGVHGLGSNGNEVSNSYFRGSINSTGDTADGIGSFNSVNNVYSEAYINPSPTGNPSHYCIINSSSISNSYYDSTLCNLPSIGIGTSTDKLKDISLYDSTWGMNSPSCAAAPTWRMPGIGNLPCLSWQSDCTCN